MTLKIVFTTTSLVFLFGITVVKDYSLVLERVARLRGSWWGQPCTKAVFIGFSLWSVVKGQQLENGFIYFFALLLWWWTAWAVWVASMATKVLLNPKKCQKVFVVYWKALTYFSFWQVMAWLECKELETPDDQSVNTFLFNSECCWGKPNDPSNISNIADIIIKVVYGC